MSLEDLQNLETETKALDAEIVTPPPGEAQAALDADTPPPMDFNAEAAQAVDMFAALIVGYAPKTADIWNDGTKDRISAALAPVMQKYGVTFGNLPPELTLLIVAGPPLYLSARIVADQMKADRAPKADKDKPAVPDAAPESGTHPQVALYQ